MTGPHANRVIGFARGDDLVALAPRLSASDAAPGAELAVVLPPGEWVDALATDRAEPRTGVLPLARAWARFPVALLARRP